MWPVAAAAASSSAPRCDVLALIGRMRRRTPHGSGRRVVTAARARRSRDDGGEYSCHRTYPPFDPDFEPPPPKPDDYLDKFCRLTNSTFKSVTMQWVKDKVVLRAATPISRDLAESGVFSEAALKVLTTPPESPGVPRSVSLTILGSVPTLLGWYGFYKFSVEEELFQDELRREGRVTGCGGYGTLLPFVFCVLAGGGLTLLPTPLRDTAVPESLITAGSLWILAGQVNLYRRVNSLWAAEHAAAAAAAANDDDDVPNGEQPPQQPPLHEWWALLPPPLDVVVGLRQVHFLARYWTEMGGEEWRRDVVAEELFPFISSERFTLREFATQPSRWFWFTRDWGDFPGAPPPPPPPPSSSS